jgi:hypothetical protein
LTEACSGFAPHSEVSISLVSAGEPPMSLGTARIVAGGMLDAVADLPAVLADVLYGSEVFDRSAEGNELLLVELFRMQSQCGD